MTPLPEISHLEMTRLIHARAQELNLPGSPAGRSAHPQLSLAAKVHFGKKSFSELSVDQMKTLYHYLQEHRRLPHKGEI